jgi:hypothetical protein
MLDFSMGSYPTTMGGEGSLLGAILDEDELRHLVGPGDVSERVGPLTGRTCMAVALTDAEQATRIVDLARDLPCVTVGVEAGPPFDPPAGLDVLLSTRPEAPNPWVPCPDGVVPVLARIGASTARRPTASLVLVQLLRFSSSLPIAGALAAESLAYSTLQSGQEFRCWLAAGPRRSRPDKGRPSVVVDRRAATLVVTLNRPEVRNAFDAAMRDELVEALTIATIDPSITRVELHGAGQHFCSGGDLVEFGTAADPASAHVTRSLRNVGALLAGLTGRSVAFVHGASVGAGVELAAFCTRVVATEDATFRLPEVEMGLIPGAGGTVSLTRRIGRERTAYMALTGSVIGAATAKAWGLVDDIRRC